MHSAIAESRFSNLQTGTIEAIADHHVPGQRLIVMIWASDCIACNQEAGEYADFHLEHHSDDAKILGVSVDGKIRKTEAMDFVNRHNIPFANLLAEWGEFANYYETVTQSGWVGTPSFLVFDPNGDLEAKQAGAIPVEIIELFLQQN